MKRTLDLSYDEIVIGSDLSALHYSYNNNCPIFYLKKDLPSLIDIEENKDSIEQWRKLIFLISIKNLCPFSDLIQNIRFIDNNRIKILTKENFECTVTFKRCLISDDYKLTDLQFSDRKESDKFKILDWFIVNLSAQEKDFNLNDSFIKKVKIIKNKQTYAVAISDLNQEQINDPDYSQTIVKILISRFLKKENINIKEDLSRECLPLEKTKYCGLPKNIHILDKEYLNIKLKNKDPYIEYLSRLFL